MKIKVYIQAVNNFPFTDNAVSAYLGFKGLIDDIIFFEQIEEVPTSKYNIVVGSIENTSKYFERFGMPPKMEMNIPPELILYARRKIEYMTMGEFKQRTELPVFVKSNARSKAFVAGVITREESRRIFFNDVPDDLPIMTSEVLDIVTEYRGYVMDKELKGLHWYNGDFRKFVNPSVIDAAIKDFTSQPAGYVIDFGLTYEGETVLIECNDGYSIGNYGLDHRKYANLLKKRWFEIFKYY